MTRDQAQGELLEVELPVCRECGLVGKMPHGVMPSQVKNYCRGPQDAPHKKRRMETARFVETR